MVRLTFKDFIKETTEMETDHMLTNPLRDVSSNIDPITGKRIKTPADIARERQEIADFPNETDRLNTVAAKIETTKVPGPEDLAKPVASGGYGKARAENASQQKRTNRYFGPSQYYIIDPELKSPSVSMTERQ